MFYNSFCQKGEKMDLKTVLQFPSALYGRLNELKKSAETDLSEISSVDLKKLCSRIHTQEEFLEKTLSKTVKSQAGYYRLHEVLYENTPNKELDFNPEVVNFDMVKEAISNLKSHTEVYAFITLLFETKDVEKTMEKVNELIDKNLIENKMSTKISLMKSAINIAKEDRLELENVTEFENHVNDYYTNIVNSFNRPKE